MTLREPIMWHGATGEMLERGDLVVLRRPHPSDREAFITLRTHQPEHLESWEPLPPPGATGEPDELFERELSMAVTPTDERLFIATHAGELVGKLSVGGVIRGPAQMCFFGYWIGAAYVGRGYMTEAVGLGLRHAFIRLGLHRVEANIQPHNEASRGVVRRNGFRLEGYSPRYINIRGEWRDHERWAITREDWVGLSGG